jgi:CheY-like chemotaxis protein
MNNKSVLIIDDSTTIRRLCDNQLSGAGYHVLMAANAEDGVAMARSKMPDLIILDHQLPGTTGYDVACQLLSFEDTAKIPVVASSTLRKKAYAEYLECDNVVDMLPKPYTPEALIATVESAIDTAAMVVQSQTDGSSVPEVINAKGESDLAGTFEFFGLREVIDLLNNGSKFGVLEVETDQCRVFVYVDKGRIQAVTASGVDPAVVTRHMPEGLSELAPVINLTVAGRRGSEVDGLVELLNNKVLDPRLLKKLLRIQAAVLLRLCFTGKLKSFRFDHNQIAPPLFQKLPLDGSLISFLVEGALICELGELPASDDRIGFVRRAIRGQNLDRAGLSSRHMKLMNLLSEAATTSHLAQRLDWPAEEARRVLHGFELAEIVERSTISQTTKVFGVVNDEQLAQKMNALFNRHPQDIAGKSVPDWLALRLLLRRHKPDVLLVEMNDDQAEKYLLQLLHDPAQFLDGVRLIGIRNGAAEPFGFDAAIEFSSILSDDCPDQQLLDAILTSNDSDQYEAGGRVAPVSLGINCELGSSVAVD